MGEQNSQTTVLTLRLNESSMHHFEELRRQHFPAAMNRIPAHVTLFHQLPFAEEVRASLAAVASGQSPFPVQVTGLRSLGRGTAFTLESRTASALHERLSRNFEQWLIPQDRQRFRAHVVVQNKATSEAARELLETLRASFTPRAVTAVGLDWWEYQGGPWSLLETFPFEGAGWAEMP